MIVLTPRISEQTYKFSNDNVYVFNVDKSYSKNEIKAAVEKQFGVTVDSINTSVVKGKVKASNRKNRRPVYGSRKDIKKAYVTLIEGDKISIFEELQ